MRCPFALRVETYVRLICFLMYWENCICFFAFKFRQRRNQSMMYEQCKLCMNKFKLSTIVGRPSLALSRTAEISFYSCIYLLWNLWLRDVHFQTCWLRQRKLNSPTQKCCILFKCCSMRFTSNFMIRRQVNSLTHQFVGILLPCSWTIDTKYYTADVCIWTVCIDAVDSGNHLRSAWESCEALVMVFDLSEVRNSIFS